jgi:zinc protease
MSQRATRTGIVGIIAVFAAAGAGLAARQGHQRSGLEPLPHAARAVAAPWPTAAPGPSADYHTVVLYDTLPNGLRVVLSPDTTAPVVTIEVAYGVGFRMEPRGRTGFAHLFEHLMLEGSPHLGKAQSRQLRDANGGVWNAGTRFDYTRFYETVPSNALETMLWAEADRMSGLAVTRRNLENQQAVVVSEVRLNILNQPYGAFPWLDLPQAANENWYNAHNFYGDLRDIRAATMPEAKQFFDTYYTPRNAVLVVSGDLDTARTIGWVRRYFGSIPRGAVPPRIDVTEPDQQHEKRVSLLDPLAPRPALALGYHMPPRGTPAYYAMGLLDQILLQGRDSRLWKALVDVHGFTGEVEGGANLLGNFYNYGGPMLWSASLRFDRRWNPDSIVAVADSVIAPLRTTLVDSATLAAAIVKARSSFYQLLFLDKADVLATFALFDGNPAEINEIDARYRSVSPELIRETARAWLRPTNRTVLLLLPPGLKAPPDYTPMPRSGR